MKGSGDQKFTPGLGNDILRRVSTRSQRLSELYSRISGSLNSTPPSSLGYPGKTTQSGYYLGEDITKQEISLVSAALEHHGIFPENTRIRKAEDGSTYEVLVASTMLEDGGRLSLELPANKGTVMFVRGDHASELEKVCNELAEAAKYAANDVQRGVIQEYIESFRTGSLDSYRDSQRKWVTDKGPRVENIFGFVEPYRDPHGVRAEFEALVAIADAEETKLLARLVENSATFIRRLPWAAPENDGKGPFEKSLFEPPDFSSIHSK